MPKMYGNPSKILTEFYHGVWPIINGEDEIANSEYIDPTAPREVQSDLGLHFFIQRIMSEYRYFLC